MKKTLEDILDSNESIRSATRVRNALRTAREGLKKDTALFISASQMSDLEKILNEVEEERNRRITRVVDSYAGSS